MASQDTQFFTTQIRRSRSEHSNTYRASGATDRPAIITKLSKQLDDGKNPAIRMKFRYSSDIVGILDDIDHVIRPNRMASKTRLPRRRYLRNRRSNFGHHHVLTVLNESGDLREYLFEEMTGLDELLDETITMKTEIEGTRDLRELYRKASEIAEKLQIELTELGSGK